LAVLICMLIRLLLCLTVIRAISSKAKKVHV
jgi:hypothetical protein